MLIKESYTVREARATAHLERSEENRRINKRIGQWMGLGDVPLDFTYSLDAMAKAEAMVACFSTLWPKYIARVIKLAKVEVFNLSYRSMLNLLRVPAHVRAQALAEVLKEMKNGEHR